MKSVLVLMCIVLFFGCGDSHEERLQSASFVDSVKKATIQEKKLDDMKHAVEEIKSHEFNRTNRAEAAGLVEEMNTIKSKLKTSEEKKLFAELTKKWYKSIYAFMREESEYLLKNAAPNVHDAVNIAQQTLTDYKAETYKAMQGTMKEKDGWLIYTQQFVVNMEETGLFSNGKETARITFTSKVKYKERSFNIIKEYTIDANHPIPAQRRSNTWG